MSDGSEKCPQTNSFGLYLLKTRTYASVNTYKDLFKLFKASVAISYGKKCLDTPGISLILT